MGSLEKEMTEDFEVEEVDIIMEKSPTGDETQKDMMDSCVVNSVEKSQRDSARRVERFSYLSDTHM